MRKFLVGSVAFLGLTAAASAADYRAAPPPVPVFSWTGFYIGLNAGYVWSEGDITANCINNAGVPFGTNCHVPLLGVNRESSSWLAGGQIGYNYQFRGWGGGSWVFGAEADLQATDLSRRNSQFLPVTFSVGDNAAVNPNALTYAGAAEIDWFGTVRGRLGFAWDRLLVYGTGGAIFANVKTSHFLNRAGDVPFLTAGTPLVAAGPGNLTSVASVESIVPGWIVGGGFEYAFWNNVSLKVEGMYYELQRTHAGNGEFLNNNILQPTLRQMNTNAEHTGFLVRGGINWRFWGM
jgi:outer membrane immunogenic protein